MQRLCRRLPRRGHSQGDSLVTDNEKCISCGACIYLCPTQTRQYRGEAYETAARMFEAKCAPRREPEVFF